MELLLLAMCATSFLLILVTLVGLATDVRRIRHRLNELDRSDVADGEWWKQGRPNYPEDQE